MIGLGRPSPTQVVASTEERFEVVVFRVGSFRLAAPRDQVKHIRPSPRLRNRLGTVSEEDARVPLVSLSLVLALDRDNSVDRRVLEVVHWGRRLGLEVTAIEGIRIARFRELHALPELVQRSCASQNVLGLLEPERPKKGAAEKDAEKKTGAAEKDEEKKKGAGEKDTASPKRSLKARPKAASKARGPLPTVVIDLSALLVEQGVEVPEDEPMG